MALPWLPGLPEILPAGQIAAPGPESPAPPPSSSPRLTAPPHLEAHFRGLLLPGERLEVREVARMGVVELRLIMPDAEHGRRWAVGTVDCNALESASGRHILFLLALERLRAGCPFWHDSMFVPPDLAAVLVEFAKADKREDFRWLAMSAGVQEGQLEELWRGTLARLGGARQVAELTPERWD